MPQSSAFGRIECLEPRFDSLVCADAKLEVLADGFSWLEGPVWHRKGKYLLFSDIPANAIYRWDEECGVRLFLRPSGYTGREPFPGKEPGSNGLTLDAQGRLVLCEHGDRRITRLEPHGVKTTLVDRYHGRRLNSPNDLVFHSNGDLYFTDPPFGLPETFTDPTRELPFNGVYCLRQSGDLKLLLSERGAPNGLAFSPDEKTLYLSDDDPKCLGWWAYSVRADGTLATGRMLAAATRWARERAGAPDGLKVDEYGNLFATGPEGVYVFAPDGLHLGSIFTGVPTGNLAWGDDGSALYIAAQTRLLRIRVLTTGSPPSVCS
jgi:gluconolactonase